MLTKLSKIQAELKAPKSRFNKFGGYKYRSTEDITEAIKPFLAAHNCVLTITDDIVEVAGRVFVKSTAIIEDQEVQFSAVGFAELELSKKGMDLAQLTGSASSYARKYALNGLLCIDDTQDSDATNMHDKEVDEPKQKPVFKVWEKEGVKNSDEWTRFIKALESGKNVTVASIEKAYTLDAATLKQVTDVINTFKKSVNN